MKHAMHFVNKYPSHNSNDGVNDSDYDSDNGNNNDNGNDNDNGDNINFCLNSLQLPGHPI